MKYVLIRSQRKTLALFVNPQAELIVRAPKFLSTQEIEKAILKSRVWIEKHIQIQKSRFSSRSQLNFVDEDLVYFKGEKITLKTNPSDSRVYLQQSNLFIPKASSNLRKKFLKKFYSENTYTLARLYIQELVSKDYKQPKHVRISRASRQWGSCSREGVVSFSWRLSMLPESVFKYVVVHELSHLEQHNHSKKFWKLVARVFPNYKEIRKWLRTQGYQFNL